MARPKSIARLGELLASVIGVSSFGDVGLGLALDAQLLLIGHGVGAVPRRVGRRDGRGDIV
jgi:hypothetical protein